MDLGKTYDIQVFITEKLNQSECHGYICLLDAETYHSNNRLHNEVSEPNGRGPHKTTLVNSQSPDNKESGLRVGHL